MKKWLLLCLSLFWGYANELPTVSSVDLERYLGRWYEIAGLIIALNVDVAK